MAPLNSTSSVNSVSSSQMHDINEDDGRSSQFEESKKLLILGNKYYRDEKYDEAIDAYKKALDLNQGKGVKIYIALARAYKTLKDYNSMMKCYSDGISAEPTSADLYCERASNYEGEHKWRLDKALEDYDTALELEPANTKALAGRALIHTETKKYARAIQDIANCMANHFNSSALKECKNTILLNTNNSEDCYSFGLEFYQRRQYKDALLFLSKAIDFKPNFDKAFFVRAKSYQRLKRYNEAEKDYDKAIELFPSRSIYYGSRAECFTEKSWLSGDKKKLYEKAVADYSKALELEPEIKEFRLEKAKILGKYNNEEAINELSKLIAEYPNEYDPYMERAQLLQQQKQKNSYLREKNLQQAVRDYQAAIKVNPNFQDAYINLANLYEELHEYNAAEKAYENAISLETDADERQKLEVRKRKMVLLGKRGSVRNASEASYEEVLIEKVVNAPAEIEVEGASPSISLLERASSSISLINVSPNSSSVQEFSEELTGDTAMQTVMQDAFEPEIVQATQIIEEESVVSPLAKKQKIDPSTGDMLKDLIVCQISGAIMLDPVIASDGHTYEREVIEEILKKEPCISPLTRQEMKDKALFPNKLIKEIIDRYLKKNSQLYKEIYFSGRLQQQTVDLVRRSKLEQLKAIVKEDERLLQNQLVVRNEPAAPLIYFICKYGDIDQLNFVLSERERLGIVFQTKEGMRCVEAVYQNQKLKQHVQLILTKVNWSAEEYNDLLWRAIENTDTDSVAEWCINRVADINYSDENGRTYLHRTAQLSKPAIARLLLARNNIDVLLQDKNEKRTALHYAASNGNVDIARLILLHCQERGLNFDIIDRKGKTPKDLAEQHNFMPLVSLFREFAQKDYTPQLHWVRNFSLFYKKEKFEIPGDCHLELRSIREPVQESEGNVVVAKITFLFKLKDEKFKEEPYKYCDFFVMKQGAKSIHVRTEYNLSSDEFVKDLVRYHPDRKKRIEELYQKYRMNGSQSFPRAFHHSERAIFKYLENEKVINEYVDKLALEIQKKYELGPHQVRVISAVLDMNSTRYLCNYCEPATHYFQNPQSLFMRRLKKELEQFGFILPKKHDLYMITRYSAEIPCGDEDAFQKTEAEHEGVHIRYDINEMRSKRFSLILQRDNTTTLEKNQTAVAAVSRERQASSMNGRGR